MQALKRILKKFWSIVGTLTTVWTLVGWVGFGPFVAGLILTAAAVAGAAIEQLPYTVMAVLGLAAFSTGLVIFTAPKWLRALTEGKRVSAPAYNAWDNVEEFMLFQAACLWAEIEPTFPLPAGEPYARFTMLKEAVRKNQLPKILGVGETLPMIQQLMRREPITANAQTFVRRSDLSALVESRGLTKPRFLFPDA